MQLCLYPKSIIQLLKRTISTFFFQFSCAFILHILVSLSLSLFFINKTCGSLSAVFTPHFDVVHYLHISAFDYGHRPEMTAAFFPLFGFVLRLVGNSLIYASAINTICYGIGLYLIMKTFKIPIYIGILYISLPTQFFFYIPYSESLYFLTISLLLISLAKSKTKQGITSALMSSVTRAAGTVLLPSLLVTSFLYRRVNATIFSIALCFIVGTVAVVLYQYPYTHNYLAYMNAQQHWSHKLQWPKLPFDSWNYTYRWIDYTALYFGFICILITIRLVFLATIKGKLIEGELIVGNYKSIPFQLMFSLLCISALTVFTLAYKGGLLFSLNRYLFCAPFFLILLSDWAKLVKNNKFLLIVGLTLAYISCHMFIHIVAILIPLIGIAYILLIGYLPKLSKIIRVLLVGLLYLAGVIFQSYQCSVFYNDLWVA